MPSFADTDALVASLWSVRLGAYAERVVATARPCLRFQRVQAPDDAAVLLASRIGGLPALPDGLDWPMRPAFADAERRAQELDKSHATTLSGMTEDHWNKTLESMRAYMSAEDLANMKNPYSPEIIEGIKRAHTSLRASYFSPMPLCFVAQLNLDQLSAYEGFDPALPKQGVLLFFHDITDFDHPGLVLHLDTGSMTARAVPQSLIDFANAQGFSNTYPWDTATACELLNPFDAISVPHHWARATDNEAMREWVYEQPGAITFASDYAEEGHQSSGDFGDQLGGWPEDVQDHPEFDMDPPGTPRLFAPGQTPWRMLFSYGAEFFHGTHLIPYGGDGQFYWMLHQDDLSAHRWTNVRVLYQQT